jgi:hypothetical protein
VCRHHVCFGKSGNIATPTSIYFVQTKCLCHDCNAPARFNVIADKQKDHRQLTRIARGKALYGKAYCEARHQLVGPASSIVAIGIDTDWIRVLEQRPA